MVAEHKPDNTISSEHRKIHDPIAIIVSGRQVDDRSGTRDRERALECAGETALAVAEKNRNARS